MRDTFKSTDTSEPMDTSVQPLSASAPVSFAATMSVACGDLVARVMFAVAEKDAFAIDGADTHEASAPTENSVPASTSSESTPVMKNVMLAFALPSRRGRSTTPTRCGDAPSTVPINTSCPGSVPFPDRTDTLATKLGRSKCTATP